MMDKLIENFPKQLKEAITIGDNIIIRPHNNTIDKVIILGMGGSGIGGDFVSSFIIKDCKVPIVTNKSYSIPGWVDEHTLIIASSYSGNTEETISALRQSLDRGSKIVCVCSGGILAQEAEKYNLDLVKLPQGISSPRACLGYSIVQQLYILLKCGLINQSIMQNLKSTIDLLKYDQDSIKEIAKEIASSLYNKTIVIYSNDVIEPVAMRWRQQINENAKCLAWHHVFPEMNHNELVGWKEPRENLAVLVLRNRDDHNRTSHRIDFCSRILGSFSGFYAEVNSKGNSIVERSMYLVHIGDWVSYYLALMNKVDPVEIQVIDDLKKELSGIWEAH